MNRNQMTLVLVALMLLLSMYWVFVSKKSATIPVFSAENCVGAECLQITQLTPPVADVKKAELILQLYKMTSILLENARQTSDRYPAENNFPYLLQAERRNLAYLEDLLHKYGLRSHSLGVEDYLPQHSSILLAYQKTQMHEEARQKFITEKILPQFSEVTDLGRIAKQIYTDSYYYHIPTLRRLIQMNLPSPTLSR